MDKKRIVVLDSFRCIAIMMVICWHYFTYWTFPYQHNDYPYGTRFSDFFISKNGRHGVQLFFMISGFVIYLTLQNLKSYKEYLFHRVIRLLPSMIIISLLVFLFFCCLGNNFLFYQRSTSVANFFTSITFINPAIVRDLTGNINIDYISGSYWSLWPEIQFYIICGAIFFMSRRNFLTFFLIFSVIVSMFNYVLFRDSIQAMSGTLTSFINGYKVMLGWFNLPTYLCHFSIGIFYSAIFIGKAKLRTTEGKIQCAAFLLLVLYQIHTAGFWPTRLFYIFFNLLFCLFLFMPKALSFLHNKLLSAIGVSSYILYLVHEQVGVTLINKIPNNYPVAAQLAIVFTIIAGLIFFAYFMTKTVEAPIIKKLKGYLKPKPYPRN